MTTTSKTRAGIYCRISDDRAGQGLGVERQRRDCVRLADQLGWVVTDTYTDNDISAYSGKRRPEYQRLLGDIAAGSVTGVIIWHPDRLNRSPRELERLIDLLERHAVAVASVTAGFFDLGTPSGRAIARTLGAWARFESEHKSERIKAQKYQQALQGAPNRGSHRPFGYAEDHLSIVPEEAKIIREMVRRLLGGESTAQLKSELIARGIRTTQGNWWRANTLGRMLSSARIAGWRSVPISHGSCLPYGDFLTKAQWPAIVSRADVERVRLLLGDETLRPGSNRRWLLSGIALCGLCGHPMFAPSTDTPRRRYSCTRDGTYVARCTITITCRFEVDVTERLHAAVKDGLIRRVLDAGPAAFTPSVLAVRDAEQRLRQLGQERDDGLIDTLEWQQRRTRIQQRTQGQRAIVTCLEQVDLVALNRTRRSFRTTWNELTMRQQRAAIQLLTHDITVMPGRRGGRGRGGYNPERVHVRWRS